MRTAGAELVGELVESFGSPPMHHVCAAVLHEASQGIEQNWTRVEAAMLLLGTTGRAVAKKLKKQQIPFKAGDLAEIFQAGLRPGLHPALAARALWCAARLAPALSTKAQAFFAEAAVRALAPNFALPVRAAACRATVLLHRIIPKDLCQQMLEPSLLGAVQLLQDMSQDTFHIPLEALSVILEYELSENAAAAVSGRLCPVLLQLWTTHLADRNVTMGVVDVLESLARWPTCHPILQKFCYPFYAF